VRAVVVLLLASLAGGLTTLPTGAATLAASTVSADIPSGDVVADGDVPAITGQVTQPAKRAIQVQAKTDTGWLTLGATTTQADGTFELATPTWWVGDRVLRVYAPATSVAAAAYSSSETLKVTTPYTPRGGTAYRHLGNRSRWDGCQVITYRVNPDRMPSGALRDVKEAFRRLSQVTGLRFRYAGGTSFVPYRRGASSWLKNADLALAWAPPRLVPGLSGTVVGLGGYAAVRTTTRFQRITQGYVVLDSTSRMPAGFGGHRFTRGMALLHELGHAVGLDHVSDRRQVMYPTLLPQPAEYARGDLNGLQASGAAQGCFPQNARMRSADPIVVVRADPSQTAH
jgi:hypothetical protein